jgi:hypothetical protein
MIVKRNELIGSYVVICNSTDQIVQASCVYDFIRHHWNAARCQPEASSSLTFLVSTSLHTKRPLGDHKGEWINCADTQVGLTLHERPTTQRKLTVFGK